MREKPAGNAAIEVVEERLFVVLPVLDGEQEEIGLGQRDHVVEAAHARPAQVADQQLRLAQHRRVHRVAYGVLDAPVLVLERRYRPAVLVVVVLVFRVDRDALERENRI